ncbi:hypothetical protein QUH73_14875 [Labilibaculum sp. K2S]|uniref:hypothetical protein n=1 Tax=Labilibaculum sp. K2S TaxID=3056386 RepID=UPI0025A3C892|nr:hypothetical protein [Labilibaculum sp. K2S]MDM8161106.1 hypothetical protein [Labilibaculum sp. K2S]
MKHYYLLLLLSIISVTVTAQQNEKYAIEFSASTGVGWYTSLDDVDKKLNDMGHPSLTKDMDILQTGGGNFTFKMNKWGFIIGGYSYNIKTSPNSDKHYYDGSSETYELGLSYDLINADWFTFSPYITVGTEDAEIFLDYKFQDGVTPTSLSIVANESNITTGGKFYFRVKTWEKDRLQLFINTEVSYKFSMDGTWRFNNMLIDSDDFNLSNVSAMGGLTLRYLF